MAREENIPYQVYCPSSRHSVSRNSISKPILKGIRVSDQQIPHGVYTDPFTNTRPKVERERTTSSAYEAFGRVSFVGIMIEFRALIVVDVVVFLVLSMIDLEFRKSIRGEHFRWGAVWTISPRLPFRALFCQVSPYASNIQGGSESQDQQYCLAGVGEDPYEDEDMTFLKFADVTIEDYWDAMIEVHEHKIKVTAKGKAKET
ncbi:hypothetical protein GIB67_010290 [Kingdonia uniflora]|uniref:Uncharacterized protein n=1 Tax=Kingdonia uniflora TaxID=39325 RepID=A0A7J7MA11_9MAGN|nr:hypothetical protein GIB67_010290 [Kingdonia uniflora]